MFFSHNYSTVDNLRCFVVFLFCLVHFHFVLIFRNFSILFVCICLQTLRCLNLTSVGGCVRVGATCLDAVLCYCDPWGFLIMSLTSIASLHKSGLNSDFYNPQVTMRNWTSSQISPGFSITQNFKLSLQPAACGTHFAKNSY